MGNVRIGTLVAAVALTGCVSPSHSAAQSQSALEAAAATITEAEYLQRVGVIAHDSMGGRDTPSPGLDKTAAWIASELERFGLRGGAPEGGFIQRYPIPGALLDRQRSMLTGGSRPLSYGRDLLPMLPTDEEGEARGGLVVVSGSRAPERGFDAASVRGQHVLYVLSETAEDVDQGGFRLMLGLREAGAASVLVVTAMDPGAWAELQVPGGALRPYASRSTRREPFRPMFRIHREAARDLVAGRDVDLARLGARFGETLRLDPVPEITLTITQRLVTRDPLAPNVVGILEGSDPALRNEYVVFSAHMDGHGATAPDAQGDSIFNGADDDASGTIAVVEIAEAFASLAARPRRSMIFLLVSGEEKGLWGSEHYANNPSVPAAQMVANLNMDMVGRNWTDTIVAIGKEHSDLGATLERVNRAHPELRMTAIDDLWPQESFYTRSDHFNFAVKGVPILFFFNGTHADYHGRDDEVGRIDGEKAARIARLVFYLGAEIANADAKPAWNPDSYRSIVGRSR